jgi:hypothetical protein
MILNEGLNKTRDLLNAGVDEGDWGTGTAAAYPTDAGLQTAGSGVSVSTTNSVYDKTVTITAVMPSTNGGTAAYAEHVTRFTDGQELNRVSFSPITKSSQKSIHNITTIVLSNGNI